jgi:hypothetical protein
MNIAALRSPQAGTDDAPVQRLGKVVEHLPEGSLYRVECDDGAWQCRRAASCLLRPELGDTVLIAGPDRYHVYLIAVIDQADDTTAHIETKGRLTLATPAGGVHIESGEAIRLQSAKAVEVSSERFALTATQADCKVDRLNYVGNAVKAMATSIHVVGRLCETVMDRLVHISRTAFRMTEQTEQVRCGQLDYEATDLARIHATQTVVTAQAVVKVDAKQIHMG